MRRCCEKPFVFHRWVVLALLLDSLCCVRCLDGLQGVPSVPREWGSRVDSKGPIRHAQGGQAGFEGPRLSERQDIRLATTLW
jgi:hypothetical protein